MITNESKKNGHALLGIAVFLAVMLCCSIYAPAIPNASAAEVTTQQKGLSLLSSVVALDLSKYNTTPIAYPDDTYRDTLNRKNIQYALTSEGSNITLHYAFINEKLQMILVLDNQGTPRMKLTATSAVGMAQSFLNSYQIQTGDSLYGDMKTLLTKVDANKNTTAISGNIKLKVTTSQSGQDTTFSWTYYCNGIEAPDKCIAIRYENGFLKYFVDNWDLYNIGNTKINLSEKEAIDIAMSHAKAYSLTHSSDNTTVSVMRFNVTNAMLLETIYSPSIYVDADKVRSSDLFEAYPLMHVWVSLDKFYPGNIYGFDVYIWADTKQVCYIHNRISTVDPPADLVASVQDYTAESLDSHSSSEGILSSLPTVASVLVVTVTIPIYLYMKKTSRIVLPKLRVLKVNGLLLILLILSSVLMIAVSASVVSATPYYGKASVWGSESIGAWNENLGFSWRKVYNNEVTDQQYVASNIASWFSANGYSADNAQGSNGLGSLKTSILDQISTNAANYARMVVVDFDHGVGKASTDIQGAASDEFHFLFEDNWGTREGPTFNDNTTYANVHAIYDTEVYNRVGTSGAYFAFINACNSAHIADYLGSTYVAQGLVGGTRARGMPFAWTHCLIGTQLRSDGYYSSTGTNCYIGFEMGSAALQQTVGGVSYPYYYWVCRFFYQAISADYTIRNALDLASHDIYGAQYDFDQTALYLGFTSVWPMYRQDPQDGVYKWMTVTGQETGPGYMKVYGNSNLKLYQPALIVGNNLGATFTVDGNNFGSSASHRVYAGTHTIDVTVPAGYRFDHFTIGTTTIYYHPISLLVNQDTTLTAHFTR